LKNSNDQKVGSLDLMVKYTINQVEEALMMIESEKGRGYA